MISHFLHSHKLVWSIHLTPHIHLYERHLESLFRMSDSAKQSQACFLYPFRRVWIDNLATNSSSTENVKKLAGVAAGKETAIGARCKDKLLITHILKFKSVKGVGGKYLRTIRMRNNQVLKNKIINFHIVCSKFGYLGAVLIVRV